MRKIFLPAIGTVVAVLMSNPAFAEAPISVACKAFAAAVADDYMSDQMERISDGEGPREGFVLAHVYGRKYMFHVNKDTLYPRAIGASTQEWGRIYKEERMRCLRTRLLNDFTLGN